VHNSILTIIGRIDLELIISYTFVVIRNTKHEMRRPYTLTLGAFALPVAISGGSLGNTRKMHFAGLGDGNIDTQQGLRGAGNKRKRTGRRRGDSNQEDLVPSPFLRTDAKDAPRNDFRRAASNGDGRAATDSLDDTDLIDYLRKGGDRRAAPAHREDPILQHGDEGANNQTLASDGPWQLSVLVLLGIMCVLMGLFIHFSTDPIIGQTPYFRRRMKVKKNPKYLHSPSCSKKFDDLNGNEDDEVTEDDNYRGDTEGAVGGSIAKKRTPMPKAPDDPTAILYYQSNTSDNFRQQEHRLRKSATQQSSKNMTIGAAGGRSGAGGGRSPFHSPSRPSRSSTPSGNGNRKVDIKASSSPFPSPPFPGDNSGIGFGLEGFEHSGSFSDAGMVSSNKPLVKPMGTFTPTESFASIGSMSLAPREQVSVANTFKGTIAVGSVDFNTPPESLKEEVMNNSFSTSSPFHSGDYTSQYSEKLSELPTPRVDHTRGKRELARVFQEQGRKISSIPLSCTSTEEDAAGGPTAYGKNAVVPDITTLDLQDAFPGLPLVPNLNVTGESLSSFHIDAPRSLALEELQLFRMESGVSGPRWRTKYELEHNTASMEEQRQQSENMEKLREASAAVDPVDDPRNSIQHIRKDLTISSDASDALSSKITFSELKLGDVIGGGGFGQVWKAKWKGTPVAVKVLTGSAQAETVPKAVLEEFIAEINMVSGMRHPNICLFMGACLEPPNRAIVTELCENGSLWDALRSPLSAYQVADGNTRLAWPLNIYEPRTSPPPTIQEGRHVVLSSVEPPLAPGGAWPWVLVKRVAAGTARGMCYLHSGNPPVLHRDLKSANILLDESYTAKLADFGLSRLKAVRSGMTGNCGTVQWMAPEVLCNEDYAEPADVYSFGIILWEMLTKECPYDGMTPIQCALSVLNENKRPEIPEWCPQSLRALIKKCVERDPHSRPTFTQILAALDALP